MRGAAAAAAGRSRVGGGAGTGGAFSGAGGVATTRTSYPMEPSARRTVRDAGWTGWNETEVAWTEGDADGTATVFLLPMDSPGVRSVAC